MFGVWLLNQEIISPPLWLLISHCHDIPNWLLIFFRGVGIPPTRLTFMGVNGICSILMGLQSNTWGFGLEPKQSCLSQDCQLLAEDQHPSRSIHHQSKLAS
jgi:hypothetical protein